MRAYDASVMDRGNNMKEWMAMIEPIMFCSASSVGRQLRTQEDHDLARLTSCYPLTAAAVFAA